MAIIQLLGRWSSRAIERYTQSAPLALAPSAPAIALAGGAATSAPGSGSQLAVPLALADAPTDEGQSAEGPGHRWLPRPSPRDPRRRAPRRAVCAGGPAGTSGPGGRPGARALRFIEAMVVWCAAPPCQDFSRIAKGAGHQGDRGRLFEESVADELRAALKSHRFAFLYENVEMGAEAAKVSSDALGVQPVFVCSSDFGWVSRPRLWWLSVDWSRLAPDPADGSPLEWAKKGRWDRLRLAAVRPSADSFDLSGLEFHSSVAQGRKLMPCATTPAPQALALHRIGHAPGFQGRPSHPAARGEGAASPYPGRIHRQGRADARTRHRMVGNGWHWGVASRLL